MSKKISKNIAIRQKFYTAKNKTETLLQDFSLFYTLLIAKKKTLAT